MAKWVLSFVGLLAFAAGPAAADVFIVADIFKFKDIVVFEEIDIYKDVYVNVLVDSFPDSVAESDAIVNQTNELNYACENCAEKRDTIIDSANFNSGIATVNQAAGNNNNQGSAISIAIDVLKDAPPGEGTDSFAEAQAAAQQSNLDNRIEAVNLLFRDAIIERSVNDNIGVVHVNQAAGNNNNQLNELAIALGLSGAGVALAEADLGQFNSGNTNWESDDGIPSPVGINKLALINDSVNRNTGVIGVNQTAGNMANQANVVAFAAAE
jgi:hypothetical protein